MSHPVIRFFQSLFAALFGIWFLSFPAIAAPQERPLLTDYYWSENSYSSTGSIEVWDSTGWLIDGVYVQTNTCTGYGLTATNSYSNGEYRFPAYHNIVVMAISGTPSASGSCTYQIRIDKKSTDTDDYVTWNVYISNVNEGPYDLSLSSSTITENLASGTLVGSLSTSDPDLNEGASDSFSYSLQGGDTSAFSISGSGLYSSASFNYESTNTYSLLIRTRDSGSLTYDKWFTIYVSDTNETPGAPGLSASSIAENSPITTFIGTISAIDPDGGAAPAYTLPGGYGDNAAFTIAGASLLSNAVFNYEAGTTKSIRIRATDAGGLYAEQDLTITITNIDEAPDITNPAPAEISMLEDNSAAITVIASDPENSALTYTAAGQLHGSVSASGATFTYTPDAHYNGSDSFTITVRDSASLSSTLAVNATVTAVNDEPGFTAGADETTAEDAGLISTSGWASGIGKGGGSDEADQILTFHASNDNNALFSQQPAVSPDGALTYRAVADAHGSATVTLSLSDNGGTGNGGDDTTPTITFNITITPVNDAPVLDSSGSSAAAAINEDATTNSGVTVADLLATGAGGDPVSDVDDHALEGIGSGIAVIGVDSDGHGEWQYSTNGGASWTAFGSPSGASARLLISTAKVRFVPDLNWNGLISQGLTYRAWDLKPGSGANGGTANINLEGTGYTTAFSASYEIAALTVNPVNDAPLLDNSAALVLDPILEDQEINPGTSVAAIIASAGGNRITEVSYEITPVEGIAITSADGVHGIWQFSIDNGIIWSDLGAVSSTQARLLVSDTQTKLRFLPGADWSLLWDGAITPQISFRAWDQTSGANGEFASTSVNGGTSAFSTAGESATIIVTGRNDAPTFTKGADITIDEGAPAQAVSAWVTQISPGPADEVAQGQTTVFNMVYNTAPELFAVEPVIDPAGNLTFTPATEAYGTATIIFELHDTGGVLNEGEDTSPLNFFVITLRDVNDAPTFVKGADQAADEDAGAQSVAGWATAISAGPYNETWQDLTFVVSANTNPDLFSAGPAVSPGGTLTYTSAPEASGSAQITLTLHDGGGTLNSGVADSIQQTFTITVNPRNDPPVNTALPQLSGYGYVNEVLSAAVGDWNDAVDFTPGSLSYTYQWQRADDAQGTGLVDIPGANTEAYTITLTDSGKSLRVKITATDTGEGTPAAQATSAFSAYLAVEVVNLDAAVSAFDRTVSEDTLLPLGMADFSASFTQTDSLPLERVRITQLPQHGALFLDADADQEIDAGEAVSAGSEILTADLADFAYLPAEDWHGADSLRWNATEAAASGYPLPGLGALLNLTVSAVNDLPTIEGPTAAAVHEDTPSMPFNFTLGDVDTVLTDPAAQNYAVEFSADFGALALASTTGLTFTQGADHTGAMTVQGTLASLQAAFEGIIYTPQPFYTGQDKVHICLLDAGNVGAGGPLSASLELIVSISDVNNAPVNYLPDPFTIDEDTTSPGLEFEFTDDSNSYMQVTFSAEHGSIRFTNLSELTLVAGANESHAVTYRAPVLKMIKALQGIEYIPDPGYAGPDAITFTTNDLGGTGTGEALSDSDILTLVVNGAPVTVDDTYYGEANIAYNQPAVSGVLANDSDINADAMTVSVIEAPEHGALVLDPDGSFNYTPEAGFDGIDAFTYQASDGRLLSEVAGVTIYVERDLEVDLSYVDSGLEITYTYTAHNPTIQRKFASLRLQFDLPTNVVLDSVTNGIYAPLSGTLGGGAVISDEVIEFAPGETLVLSWIVRVTGPGNIIGRWSYVNDSTTGAGAFTIYRLYMPLIFRE